MNSFTIIDHLDKLTPVEGKATATTGEYYCPVCGSENFKVDLRTGKYNAFGCGCTDTEEGKRQVREQVAPSTWEKPPRPKNRQIFPYDALNQGVVEAIAEVVRIDDGSGKRQFYQCHWDGKQWVKGLPDEVKAQVRLYRIFSPINEKAKGDRIFLVEGEGKVNALLSLGIPATCALGGAGKWKQYGYPNYLEDLQGYQVVLCPDRDERGLKHCEEIEADLLENGIPVAGWLYAFPESYLWQRLPKSGGADVVDWIADGATREDILNAVETRRIPPSSVEPGQPTDSDYGDNHCAMRKQYHRIKQQVGDRLRFNQLTKGIELDGEALDLDDLQVRLAVEHNIQAPDSHFQKIVSCIARDNPYSPVVEYLDRVSAQHGTDAAILSNLSTRYFGTDHPLHNTYLRKTLIAAVSRAYEPGCRSQYTLIIQGRQGTKKSTFFRSLASNPWFDDSLGKASDKDERLKLHMVWFVEWAELETVFRRKDVSEVKQFLTTEFDLIRPPYGRNVQRMPRPSIIVGTTNETEFLSDPTGSRRFWVIPVTKVIDVDLLEQERDRIWAAAVAAYRDGEIPDLNEEEKALSQILNDDYTTEDTWTDLIEPYVNGLSSDAVTTEMILSNCLHIDPERQTKGTQMRVAGIMKRLGWYQRRIQMDGRRYRAWQRLESVMNNLQS